MKDMTPEEESNQLLMRKLGVFDSIMIVMGIIIGGGIFYSTGIMAQSIPSAGLILLAWTCGGLLSLAGALIYAELGAAMPEAGGQYIYLSRAFGPLTGFLFGWTSCLVYLAGVIAVLGMAFAEYLGYFFPFLSPKAVVFSTEIHLLGVDFPYSLSMGQILAIFLVSILSVFNFLGLVFGKTIQNIFTVIKVGTIVAFVVLGLTVGKGSPVDFSLNPTGMNIGQLISGLSVALVTASIAYGGWENLTFVAGEIKVPKRNLPVALIVGTLGVTVLYVLMNYVYLRALPIAELVGVVRVAERSTAALYGRTATGLISAAVVFSVVGALNGVILSTPRVYYAMARQGLFFRKVAQLHPRYRTPGFAILIQAVWASVLLLSGTFEQLIVFAMFAGIVFWMLTAASVLVLRRKYPDLDRPYKTWGYPVTPIVFIVATLGVLINTIFERPQESLAGVGLMVLGVPVYYFWKKRSSISVTSSD